MTDALDKLISALREELTHYGEILALLDQQQELVVVRASDDLLRTVASINKQSDVIQSARQHRQSCQREMARLLQRSTEAAAVRRTANTVRFIREEFEAGGTRRLLFRQCYRNGTIVSSVLFPE